MIHFLKNSFQNVLMTSRPRAPQTHQCFSGFGGFVWRFPGLSFPHWLLHCTLAICCGFPVLLQHWEQWWHQKLSAWDVFEMCGCRDMSLAVPREAGTGTGAGRELVLQSLAPQKQLPSAVLGREDEILVSFTIVLLGVKTLKQLSHTQSCISMSQLKSMKYRAVVLLQWFVEKKITWFLNHFYNSFWRLKK